MKKALILFAKTPRPGAVKTRLQPGLSPKDAAELYRAFILDLLKASTRLRGLTRILGCDPTQKTPFFQALADHEKLKLINQKGRNLGERMKNAIKTANRMGYGRVVIIGTDSPTLPMALIRKAFKLLDRNDLVIGPSFDGGYYLIACSKPISGIFQGIAWGADQVLSTTMKKVVDQRIKCELLPFWYDVDTIQDLRFLKDHLNFMNRDRSSKIAPQTISIIRTLRF